MKGTLNPVPRGIVWGHVAEFRAGIRNIGVAGGWFWVCCLVVWEGRAGQHTLPFVKGQLIIFGCLGAPSPEELGSHWQTSVGSPRGWTVPLLSYVGVHVNSFTVSLLSLCYNLLSGLYWWCTGDDLNAVLEFFSLQQLFSCRSPTAVILPGILG